MNLRYDDSQEWQPWHSLGPAHPLPEADGDAKGVYIVRAMLTDIVPVHIHRACGVDDQGWIYVGEGVLGSRIGYLLNLASDQDAPKPHHNLTGTFDQYRLGRIADRRLLQVTWLKCVDHGKRESNLINKYKIEFGDIPPGNLKISG